MSAKPAIGREHISFAIAGLIFGFLIGFVMAHQVYGGRAGGVVTANAPETMGGQRGAPVMAGGAGGAGGGDPGPGGGAPPGQAGGQAGGPGGMAGMQQVQQEIAALKQAIAANPKDAVALARLGNIYMDAAMWDKAVGYYTSALEVDPANVDVRTDMGACLRQMGRVQEAMKAFQDSVARDPKHWKGWFNIGIVNLYDLGDYPGAEKAFARTLELHPGAFDMNAVRAEIEKLKQEKAGKAAGSTPS